MSTASSGAEDGTESVERRPAEGRFRETRASSPFVPLLILAVAFLAWSTFQTIMLVREANALSSARDNQEVQMKTAQKIREALDAVARDTAKLADRGNPNARLIVDELRKRGVTINTEVPPPAKK